MGHEFNWFSGLIAPWINFGIFAAILVYAGRKPLAAMVAARAHDLQRERRRLEEERRHAEARLHSLEERYERMTNDLNKLRAEFLADAELQSQRIIAYAERKAQAMLQDARLQAEREQQANHQSYLQSLVREVESLLQRDLTRDFGADAQKQYLQFEIKRLASRAGGQ